MITLKRFLNITMDNVLNEDKLVLVGGCTDGASVNVGIHGMKTKMQETIPWLYWGWCFSHRLGLSCKDAFKSALFTEIEENVGSAILFVFKFS